MAASATNFTIGAKGRPRALYSEAYSNECMQLKQGKHVQCVNCTWSGLQLCAHDQVCSCVACLSIVNECTGANSRDAYYCAHLWLCTLRSSPLLCCLLIVLLNLPNSLACSGQASCHLDHQPRTPAHSLETQQQAAPVLVLSVVEYLSTSVRVVVVRAALTRQHLPTGPPAA